jgi:hypothetical protein
MPFCSLEPDPSDGDLTLCIHDTVRGFTDEAIK